MIVGDLHPPDACEVALRIVHGYPLRAPMTINLRPIGGSIIILVADGSNVFESAM